MSDAFVKVEIRNEFAAARLTVRAHGRGTRLEVTSDHLGSSALLDATVLEALTRLGPEALAALVSAGMQASDETVDQPPPQRRPAPDPVESRSGPGLPGRRGVDHIGLTVPDIEEATAFFTGLLGFVEFYSHGPYADDDGDSQVVYFDRHPRSRCVQIRMLRTHNLNLELLQFESPDQVTRVPKTSDWGSAHVAVYVDDMARAVAFLRDEGVQVLGGPLPLPGPEVGERAEFCFFLTPWGQPLELISYPEGKAYERDTSDRLYSPVDPDTVWS
ncbi:VOC family protein [Nocardioides sp. LHG3406-4]|uniref:VOC family protein n=1 Tax=Nocardioides sp. LHG3406-4 TaxID=2804575 RepID=UPI003CF65E25